MIYADALVNGSDTRLVSLVERGYDYRLSNAQTGEIIGVSAARLNTTSNALKEPVSTTIPLPNAEVSTMHAGTTPRRRYQLAA